MLRAKVAEELGITMTDDDDREPKTNPCYRYRQGACDCESGEDVPETCTEIRRAKIYVEESFS